MLFNLLIGVCGLVLSGYVLNNWVKQHSWPIFFLCCAEFLAGLYFVIAAIGGQ